jgi:hypothetical protein
MLPDPSLDAVRDAHKKFYENDLVERTVRTLFTQFPANTDPSQVVSRVIVLSQFYSARVLNIHALPLAEHIISMEIDPLLDETSSGAVERITNCAVTRKYYSFATKYCSWHRPGAFPMWDGNVDEALWAYMKRDGFHRFKRKDLWEYQAFREIVRAFQSFYSLTSFNFKAIDEFLWIVGEDLVHPSGTAESSAITNRLHARYSSTSSSTSSTNAI